MRLVDSRGDDFYGALYNLSVPRACLITFVLTLIILLLRATLRSRESTRSEERAHDTRLPSGRRNTESGADLQSFGFIGRDQSPAIMFLTEAGRFLPSITALLWIIYQNSQDYSHLELGKTSQHAIRPFYNVWCSDNVEPFVFLCYSTRTFCRLYPIVGALCVMVLSIYNLIHLRVRYILMQHGIFVLFSRCRRIGPSFSALVVLFLVIAFGHFVLKFFFLTDRYCDIGYACAPELLLNVNITKLRHTPGLVLEEHALFFRELNVVFSSYVAPACLSFLLLAVGSDLQTHTQTVDEFFEETPGIRFRNLGDCIFVNEREAEKLVDDLAAVDKPSGDDPSVVYKSFYNLAIERGCIIFAKQHTKEEAADSAAEDLEEDSHTVFNAVPRALRHMVNNGWWAEKLLVDVGLPGPGAQTFYCLLLVYVVGVNCVSFYMTVLLTKVFANRIAAIHVEPFGTNYNVGYNILESGLSGACTLYNCTVNTTLWFLAWRTLKRLR
eukprot:TRINITY_DN39705_c0_g1_i1.p1 TRINITY_DN39705_c0_g1~~TRINITY_DN39705_c0_g1_i1.p1  ORF type:complete len:496 (+),score=29.59 TRINITY_DN39705_c0_g1_i1:135-1622(+)